MVLTQTLIDEIVLAAKEVEFGSIIITISGQPDKKIVDITTEKRKRYREHVNSEGVKYQSDNG